MDILTLQKQNPWWENSLRINEDKKIVEYQQSPVKWEPRILHYIDLEKNALYSIRGPRQVGKTTLIKNTIKKLIEKQTDAKNIFFYTCDILKSPEELIEIIETYTNWIRKLNNNRIYIFLDEISTLKNWQKSLKFFIDTNNLPMTIIVTGSHTIDIKQSVEQMPGRIGEKEGVSSHKILLPMKFAEYVQTKDPDLHNNLIKIGICDQKTRKEEFLNIISGKLPKSVYEILVYQNKLDALLDEYLITGGIMIAVNEHEKNKYISSQIYELYLKQINADITRQGRDERTAKQILLAILERITTPTSWNNIKNRADIPTIPTVQQYVSILENIFLLSTIYKIDLDGEQKHLSDKKIFIQNPFMYHALNNWVNNPTSDAYKDSENYLKNPEIKSKLIESLIANHLARAAYNFKPSDLFNSSDYLFYAKTKKGKEIDFILKTPLGLRPIEVKYQNQINSEDFIGIRKLRSGVLLSKNKLEQKDFISIIPVSLFLLYI